MTAVADVYCAHTCVCIGQPSRTDALSTSLSVLFCVGVCALHSHLVTFSSLYPTWPSPAKVTLKFDIVVKFDGRHGPKVLMRMEKTRRNWWCNFRSPFFSKEMRCTRMVLDVSWGTCDYFFQFLGWTCISFIVRSLPAHCDPLQRQIGHLRISCGDPIRSE